MEFFKIRRDIPFMENALIFNVISFLTFAAAVFFLFSRGLHLSVEFTGGTVMEVSYSQPADVERVRPVLEAMGDPERILHVGAAGARGPEDDDEGRHALRPQRPKGAFCPRSRIQ